VLVRVSARVNEGLDDEAYELTASTTGDVLRSSPGSATRKSCSGASIRHAIPRASQTARNLKIEELYEVYVPRNVELSLKTTLGSSNIEHNNGPLAVETVTGNIDVRCAASQPADITAKTEMGGMYTDLPFDRNTGGGLPQLAGEESRIQLNGGGVPIALETVTGDVTIRKK
jgi:hypothetical protein